MSFYVYRIENKINGKFYIGKTSKTIDERWKRHKYDCNYKKDNTRLYNALRKYGYENFEINVIIPVEGRRTVHEWKGKFSKDVGFYVENKI